MAPVRKVVPYLYGCGLLCKVYDVMYIILLQRMKKVKKNYEVVKNYDLCYIAS